MTTGSDSHLIEHSRADLAWWEQVRAEQLRDGTAAGLGPDTVSAGDLVKIGGSWWTVARVNAKSVSLETDWGGTRRLPWHQVTAHRPRAQQETQ